VNFDPYLSKRFNPQTEIQQALANWFLACRPKTLPAAIIPVVVGSAIAVSEGTFRLVPAMICCVFALLVQIGTNFANDYFDYVKGADTAQRMGPTRAVAAGFIDPTVMWKATIVVLTLAFLIGLLLIAYGGMSLLLVGVASVICAVAYTGGPYPLGYNGLGDIFVVLFFGLIGVAFTHYVQAGHFLFESFAGGLGCGLIINNILVVNNYRDVASDRRAGKRTLVVRFGRRVALFQYLGSFFVAVVGIPLILAITWGGWGVLLPALLTPFGLVMVVKLQGATTAAEFNRLLEQTAQCAVGYGLLLAIGFLLT